MSEGRRSPNSLEQEKAKDHHLTIHDWMRLSKQTLVARASRYGLQNTGKKPELVIRILAYLDGGQTTNTVNSFPVTNPQASAPTVALQEPQPGPSHRREDQLITSHPASVQPSTNVVTLSITDLKSLLREVQHESLPQNPGLLQLSPASMPHHRSSPAASAAYIPPSTQTQLRPPTPGLQDELQGLKNASSQQSNLPGNLDLFLHSPINNLPPMSSKLIKALKDMDFIDLTSLLPNSLYEVSPYSQYSLEVLPSSEQGANSSLSLTQTKRPSQKITTLINWIEAWNVYIRGMVHFHPHLAPELLAYQESFCSINKSYPFSARSRYDIAFRMNMARKKHQSWAKLDEYAFNKFLRCAPPVPSQVICYKCHTPGHFAGECQYGFQPQWQQKQATPFRSFRRQGPESRRHYNNNNKCQNPNCPWPHTCSRCQGLHPVSNCRQPKAKFQPPAL